MRADVHMHSNFSHDSDSTPEQMILGAIDKGLKVICFTDHFDKDDFAWGQEDVFEPDEYFKVMKPLQEKYKDNIFGDLYISQKTINNFDYTICKGFERNNMIMRQIIPLSFSFNINDLFNTYERKFFTGAKFKIFGHYYTQGNTVYDMYDFDINYTHMYEKYNKYNKTTGNYDFVVGEEDSDNNEDQKLINIMNVGFPALNESKYIKNSGWGTAIFFC